jgi:signal transduction histidine kinase
VLRLSDNIPKIMAQPIQVDQVLINLCKNGIESMLENKGDRVLTISTSVHDNILEILIEDTGGGIEDKERDHLFESFSSYKKDGLGLGLSITRSIVERHYGKIYLKATSKQGSRFAVNLPLRMKENE